MIDITNLTPEEEQALLAALEKIDFTYTPPPPPEYRVYYDDAGKVITYTTETDRPGNFIVITKEQYAEARHDAIVKDGQLVFTHVRRHVMKLVKNSSGGRLASRLDASVLADPEDVFGDEYCYFDVKVFDIVR